MKDSNRISENMLNLYIDEQLDTADLEHVHAAIANDPELAEQVCQLREVRYLVNHAYQTAPEPSADPGPTPGGHSWLARCATAAGLLLTGLVGGWLLHDYPAGQPAKTVKAEKVFDFYSHARRVGLSDRQHRYIIHVTTGDPQAIRIALDETEDLLKQHQRKHMPLQLEIMVNHDISMLRQDSPFRDRIIRLMNTWNNVTFLACAQTVMKTATREGHPVKLLPHIKTSETAREHIPERLNEGWVYLKI